jgi:hypothetical protein
MQAWCDLSSGPSLRRALSMEAAEVAPETPIRTINPSNALRFIPFSC